MSIEQFWECYILDQFEGLYLWNRHIRGAAF